ncbi:dsDNA-specific endonuclease/ATPase MutS2 [Paenibacillus amylolyticus]|uniref:DsDNA-specific endonuclease/ATPase MutS2 n=1 Tax=Paenibacillus amylolyticus TaxID=1451 RepID=A0AAP5GZH6_PAEAM|nr:DNA mismatch repair protein MutS [Paenibacillus amylolyticus]MDR6723518.1 dsDNA-specific endonuclease/ATPase MutS2 [Paenibacillus amylolyticus]
MNENTLRTLNYFEIQKNVASCARSYLGKRHAHNMKPMNDVHWIQTRLEETAEAALMLRYGASIPIPSLDGMETIMDLLGTGYLFSERDFSHLAQFLRSCAQLMKYMEGKSEIAPTVSRYAASMMLMESLLSEIERSIHNGRIQDLASKELTRIRKKMMVNEERIKRKLDSLLSKHRSIMQENVISQRHGRTVLPIKKEFRKLVKGSVLDESGSGQTVYIEPVELMSLHSELAALQGDESREEMKILGELTTLTESYNREIALNTETVGILDFLLAKAKYAVTMDGRVVQVNAEGRVQIQRAHHPLMGESMVPLDFTIGTNYRSLIITGPNTGGKTIALKTLGLLTLMMQSGLLVPVGEGGTMSVYSEIAVDIGDGQSMEQALSTFSAHIRNMIGILEQANSSTLVLIDEMASGTDPGEGVGLSIAMLEELHRREATVVATTHFGEIKHFAAATPGFENARMEFDTATLQPLYRLRIGEAGQSYAYAIALKLGMAQHIIDRSKSISDQGIQQSNSSTEKWITEPSSTLSGEAEEDPLIQSDSLLELEGDHHITSQSEQKPHKSSLSHSTEKHPVTDIDKPIVLTNTASLSQSALKSKKPEESEPSVKANVFQKGDRVYIGYLDQTGTVCDVEDARGNIGVILRGRKIKIHKKRLTLHIAADQLYPDNYDLDIVFESKVNRKKRKLMGRKHVEGLQIELPPEQQ